MTTTTDFSKKRLATILSALDDAPRSPANRGEALRAIGRSAQRFGLTTEDVLAAAPGFLDGRLNAADFRVELHDLAGPDQAADSGRQGATAAQGDAETGDTPAEPTEPTEPTEPAQAPKEPTTPEPAAKPATETVTPAKRRTKTKAKPAKAAPAEKPAPRAGTKQAQLIDLLKRPEGATVEQIAAATGWQHHTIRGAISGALKKKLGLNVEATRTREVGPNKIGAKGSSTVYRIVG
jgi:outer membrane biosynthesis protein TonB